MNGVVRQTPNAVPRKTVTVGRRIMSSASRGPDVPDAPARGGVFGRPRKKPDRKPDSKPASPTPPSAPPPPLRSPRPRQQAGDQPTHRHPADRPPEPDAAELL